MKPEIITIYWCSNCETTINEGDEICPGCGNPIDWEDEEE